ncbi:MAG TPA: alcohol dehydrogenase catalytic domain-containing protein [Baekduia sp.]|nr:alcohol dehydrogenase catalytic domain-containing protein [Baekduia sp.]
MIRRTFAADEQGVRTGSVARLHGPRDVRVAPEPVPEPAPGEALVRVEAVGLCGSDLHWYEAAAIGDARLVAPCVPGHELAGTVEGGPLAGRRVAIDPAVPCARPDCRPCREGHPNLCPAVRFAGHGDCDGGLREYMAWPERALHPLPDGFDAITGALLEPLGVALHAVDLGHVRLGACAAVVGCGPIGLLLIQALRAAGARVAVAVDPLEHRRVAAAGCGAQVVVAPADVADRAIEPVDVAFEAAGTDDAVAEAIALARPGARVVLAGIPDDDRTAFPASAARRKGLTLVLVRRMKDAYPRAIRLVAAGEVDLPRLVTHRLALGQAGDAFALAAAREGLKVVVLPGERAM